MVAITSYSIFKFRCKLKGKRDLKQKRSFYSGPSESVLAANLPIFNITHALFQQRYSSSILTSILSLSSTASTLLNSIESIYSYGNFPSTGDESVNSSYALSTVTDVFRRSDYF